MKTSTLLLSMASAALVAAECPGLVPCIRQAQDANSCSGSDPACFCLENFLAVATNCLTSNDCPADDLTNLNLSYEAQCPDGPPGGASSSSAISTTEPGVPTDISSTAAPSTTAETVPTDTPTDAESSTAAPETTPGSSAPSSHVDEPTSTEHGPGSSTPVPVSTPTVIETSSVPINGTQKMTTSTIYATQVRTVTHCPETVTDCPTKPHVTTEIIAISTTICPVDETKKVPAPPTPTPAHPVKPSQGGGEHQTKTWVTTEVVKVPGTTAGGNHPGSPASSQGSTPSTPVVVTAGAGKAAFSVGGALVAAFAALL